MTGPAPVTFDPGDVAHWINVLQNAARVPKSDPRYGKARQVVARAVSEISTLNQAANAAENAPAPMGKGGAALVNAAQGATSGFMDEILGHLIAAHGGRWNPPGESYSQSQQRNTKALRDLTAEARIEHPIASLGGTFAGSFVNPLNYLLRPLTTGLGLKTTGAIYGGVLGTAQGAGEGTEGSRLPAAAVGAALGIPLGIAGSYVAGKVGPNLRQLVRNLGIGRTAAAQTPEATQAVIQREMQAARPPETPLHPDAVRAMRDFEAGKISGEDLRVAMDVAAGRIPEPMGLLQKPTLTPIPGSSRGLLGPEGISPPPKASYPPSLPEMQGFAPLAPTEVEAGVAAAAKALRLRAREAARTAYNLAITAGQSPAQAKDAAQRAAAAVGLLSP